MSLDGGVMLSLDEALSELGMLNTDSKCSRQYIQDIETKYEQRKAENAKWLKWQQQADIVRADDRKSAAYASANQEGMDQSAFSNNSAADSNCHNQRLASSIVVNVPSVSSATAGGGEHKPVYNPVGENGVSEFTRILHRSSSNSENVVVTDPANSSSNNSISIQINQGEPTIDRGDYTPRLGSGTLHPMRGGCMMPPSLRGLSSRAVSPSILSRDSQFVTNITIQHKHSHIPYYSNYKLEKDAFSRRMQFSPRRMWSQQRQQYSSPYPVINLPSTIPPCTAVERYHCGPYPPSVLKLSGVLTSFKQRTLRTRARVRFCVRDESTEQDELTAQLANIKLDTSSFKLNENGRSSISLPPPLTNSVGSSGLIGCGFAEISRRRESTPTSSTTDDAEGYRSRLIVEPRSRHMSLEPNDPLMRSDLLATSLNNLDLEESSE